MDEENINLEEKELLRWKSTERPFKVKSREFYSTIVVLAILVGVIFFFIEGLMPVLVVAAILFAVFAISRTPPQETENIVTDKGVYVSGSKFTWDDLVMFWVTKRAGADVVYLITNRNFPRQLMLVLPVAGTNEAVTVETLKSTLQKHIPLQQLPPSWMDKTIKWVGDKVPLDE